MLCSNCELFFEQKWNRPPYVYRNHGRFHDGFLRSEDELARCELCKYLSASSLSKELENDTTSNLEYTVFDDLPSDMEQRLFIGINSMRGKFERGLWFTMIRESRFKEHDITRSHVASSSTDSDESTQKLAGWIKTCDADHTLCKKSEGEASAWHPTRLVVISSSPERSLIRVEDDPAILTGARYCTLSYCWGQNPSFQMLRVETFEAFKTGFDASRIPKTFQDAIRLMKLLGYMYIWIDAYCIIQDSPGGEDWHHESATMSQVYSNSELNIAASASDSVEGGLFRDRIPALMNGVSIQSRLRGSDRFWIIPFAHWMRKMRYEPLNLRAWAFQERRLATRTIHCTATELIWECNSQFASEIFPSGKESADGGHIHSELAKLRKAGNYDVEWEAQLWKYLVGEYSQGFLTQETDRLVAIAGLAMSWNSKSAEQGYFAGLWKARLPQDLLWLALNLGESTRGQRYIAPSWSWASIPAGRRIDWLILSSYQRAVAKVTDIQTKAVTNTFGSVAGGYIRLQARICPMTVTNLPRSVHNRAFDEIWALRLGGRIPSLDSVSPRFDYDEDYAGKQLYSIEIMSDQLSFMREPIDAVPSVAEGLLLEPTGKKGEYRRVGKYRPRYHKIYDNRGWISVKQKIRYIMEIQRLDRVYNTASLDEHLYEEYDGHSGYTISII